MTFEHRTGGDGSSSPSFTLDTDLCPVCGHKKTPTWAKAAGLTIIAAGAVLALSIVVLLVALIWRNI